jgi:hypothetical protein
MKRSMAILSLIFAVLLTPRQPRVVAEQSSTVAHARMASIDQYLMSDRNAEITLARSAARGPYRRMRRFLY